MLDLSDQGREAEQMAEKRNGEERKERRKGGGEEAYREGTQGWKVMTVWSSGRGTIATSKGSAVQGSPGGTRPFGGRVFLGRKVFTTPAEVRIVAKLGSKRLAYWSL